MGRLRGLPPLRYLRCFATSGVLLADATVVRLHHLLARVYPATRTHHTRAAVKLHALMSVTGAGRQS